MICLINLLINFRYISKQINVLVIKILQLSQLTHRCVRTSSNSSLVQPIEFIAPSLILMISLTNPGLHSSPSGIVANVVILSRHGPVNGSASNSKAIFRKFAPTVLLQSLWSILYRFWTATFGDWLSFSVNEMNLFMRALLRCSISLTGSMK